MKIKVAINPSHKNKMPNLASHEMKEWWRLFNGGFKNVRIPVGDFIRAISSGYSYTAQHRQYRKASNFIAGQHIGLDFDTGDEYSSIDYLLSVPLIHDHAAFIHTTPSHTEQNPRARVVFLLPHALRNVHKYSAITEAFANTMGTADQSCSDPVRIFFGNTGCKVQYIGNTIEPEVVTDVVLKYKEKIRRRIREAPKNVTVNGSISRIWSSMLDGLASTPEGQRWYQLGRTSRSAGGYVAGGYMSETQAFDDLLSVIAPLAKDVSVAEDRIRWGLEAGQSEPLYLEEDLDPIMQSAFG